MALEVIKPGILSTVRDLGRVGYRRFGVNPTGAMDKLAVRIGNALVGNSEIAAVLEAHFPAPEIAFTCDTLFAITGADFGPILDEGPIKMWSSHFAPKGGILRFASKILGNRAYITIAGGIRTPTWLGSSTTNLAASIGGHNGRKLAAGDIIETGTMRIAPPPGTSAGPSVVPKYHTFPTVRAIKGAEFAGLTAESKDIFANGAFEIGKASSTMGFQLSGKKLDMREQARFLSSAVDFGTVQLPTDGEPLLLMADHQTTGGYPRIGHIITADLSLAAQLGPGDRIAFHLVDTAEAHAALLNAENGLKMLRAACKLRSICS